MKSKVNLIHNPDFLLGKDSPRGWRFDASSSSASWSRAGNPAYAPGGPVDIHLKKPRGSALWSQEVNCKPGAFYRVEATVACHLATDGETAGCILRILPLSDDTATGTPMVTPALHEASEPVVLRTIYEAPRDVRRVCLSVGIVNAVGSASVNHVRFIRILEPDEESHALAIPPPDTALTGPVRVRTIRVCCARAIGRPVTKLLREVFGERHVQAEEPSELHPATLRADALLLPDETLPPSIRTLSALLDLAQERIVILSLPAFAKLTRGKLVVRDVEQEDDPIHARVVFANFATRGFALYDTFAYAWAGRRAGSFAQRQFRRTPELKSFCRRHGFEELLHSMCDRDVTSERPISLFKSTPRGALVVLDLEPLETIGSTMSEPALAAHLLLSILGQTQVGLGQYAAPNRHEVDLRGAIRDMGDRFEQFVVHDSGEPIDRVTEQLVTIGSEDQSYGLPLRPKPVILVRSGLTSGDAGSVYGAWQWFKQLIRPQPHPCPYAERLASRFRLAWIPCAAGWDSLPGWRRGGTPPLHPMGMDTEDGAAAVVIDLVSVPVQRVRVVLPDRSDEYRNHAAWLPRLAEEFFVKPTYTWDVEAGAAFARREGYAWRFLRHAVDVEVEAGAFAEEIHHDVLASGGCVLRLEVPGGDADFTAHSIRRTDLAATLLEQVIGLQYGLIAVNRGGSAVQLDSFAPVQPGEALIVDRMDPMLRASVSDVG